MLKQYWQVCLLVGAGLLANSATAEDTPYNRVSFTVSAEKSVENDVLTAILYASQTGQDTTALADTVNNAISWGMAIARQEEETVDSRTLGYTTNPIYKNGRIDGWQVRQSIELKSKDSKLLSHLLGQLQSQLRIQSISYSISNEVRNATEALLISDALATFKNRATQIQSNMQRAEYRVVRLNIQTVSNHPQPGFRMARSEAMMADSAPAPPSLDGGKQKVQVAVDATIELSAN